MKKTILLLLFFILGFNPAYCKVFVKSLGNTIISPNQISTSIQVVEDAFITLQFSIKVKALEQYILNTDNPQYKIPINQLYLNDGENEFQLQPNAQITLFSINNFQFMGYTKNYNCIIKNIGV